MLQTLHDYKITRRQGSVYKDPSIGNLGRTNLGRVSFPLQQEVFADVHTSISISIHNKPTGLTLIQPIVFTFNFIQSSTSTTKLRSMIRINSNNVNSLLSRDNSQKTSKLGIRNFVNNFVDFSSFGIPEFSPNFQVLQIFNNNMADLELFSQFDDFVTDLKHSCSNKIIFYSSDISQTSQGSIAESLVIDAFQLRFSVFNLPSFMENVLSKIKLSQDFFISIHNSQSKTSSININSQDISINFTSEVLFDIDLQYPLIFPNQLTGRKIPSFFDMDFKSLEQSIFINRQYQSFIFSKSRKRNVGGSSFGFSISKTPKIKLNRQFSYFLTDFSSIPNNSYCSDNQLGREIKFIPTFFVGRVM